jgi:hypothetical protein
MRATDFLKESIGDKRSDASGSDEYVINKYLVKFTPTEILFYKGGELVYKKLGDYSNPTRGDVSVATRLTTMLWEKDQQGLVPNMEYTKNIEELTLLKRELSELIRKSYSSYDRRKYTKKYNEVSQQFKDLKNTQSEWKKKSETKPITLQTGED